MSKAIFPNRPEAPAPDTASDTPSAPLATVNAVARLTRGRALEAHGAGETERAAEYARRSQILHPDEPALTYFQARMALSQDQGRAASRAFRRTVTLQPDHPGAWQYLGIQSFLALDGPAARKYWRHAVALQPDDMATIRNLLQAARQEGDWDAAEQAALWSIHVRPGDDLAAFDLGMLYLSLHRWTDGWPHYDRRIRLAGAKPRPDRYGLPYWSGVPDPDARLLVWADQNVGDEMQFAQILPDLAADVGHITLECDARLVPVFARSFPAIDVVARADPPAATGRFDAQLPQGHLGRLYRRHDDDFARGPKRWLAADPDLAGRLRTRYRDWSGGQPVIGIAWKSANRVFKGKNVPLEDWCPILRTPGARFLSLQYGEVTEDLAEMRRASGVEVLHDSSINALHDMDGFGAQLEAVDLVISISNSTIHQACGLGRPVWGMLHLRPDWRWGMAGRSCPWFPSLSLYRQTVRFEWAPVTREVAADLAEWVAGRTTS